MDGQNTNALGLLKRYRAADKLSARRSDDTNGASVSVIFYYQTTYDSTLAADLRIIQMCATVHLANNEGISTL